MKLRPPDPRSLPGSLVRPPLRPPLVAVLAAAAVVALGACGYGFSQRYVARGGARNVHVRPFENLSTEPGLGAALTAALRTELSRRGADAGEGAAAFIEGDVRAAEPVPATTRQVPAPGAGAVGSVPGNPPASLPSPPPSVSEVSGWRIAVEVHARLVQASGERTAEHAARREGFYLAGADPLETEGRRSLALRQLAQDAARDVLRAFEN